MSVTTAAELTAASIFTSADIIIVNPVNACIIFVTSIIVSAFLEFGVRFVQTSVENKNVRTIVDVVTQEITIIGVVALSIMLAQSALPGDPSYRIYRTILTLANISLFIMSMMYVLFVVLQFLAAVVDSRRWKQFEGGRMDVEEVINLRFREQRYKLAAERFKKELQRVYGLDTRDCPFNEACNVAHRRLLVKLSNLSFRVWLAMSVVVLANFGRAMLAPWSNTDELSDFEKFLNGLLYLGFTGYFITLLLVGFCLHLRSQFNGMVESKFPVLSTVGSDLVLFGDPMHCVEFMQCVVMSCNYYVTLFVTGIVQTIPGNYRIASIALFLIPIVVITVLCSWALWALSIMSLLGGLHKPSNKATVERVVRLLRGEGVSDEDDSNDDDNAAEYSDDEAIQSTLGHAPRIDKKLASKTLAAKDNAQKAKKKKPGQLLKVQKLDIDSPADNLARPLWLDPDEDWDASGTVEAGTARQSGLVDAVYLRNVDPREFQQALREAAPHLVEGGATANEAGHKCEASDEARDRTCRDGKKRPVWLDSDEDLDEQAL